MVKILCCTCKGTGLVDESQLRGHHRRLLQIVRNAHHGITLPKLVDAVYADDPNGGPLYASTVVQQIIHRVNKRLFVSGWVIKATRLGRGAKYRMVPIAAAPKKTYRAPTERVFA